MLDSRLGAVASGEFLPCDVGKTTIGELLELVHTDYKVNALKSLDDMERRTNASINRELSMVRRGFSLGMTATPPKVLRSPNFPRLEEAAPRKGFLEDHQYDAIVRASGQFWFRAFTECARTYGWHSTELKQLRCEQVDLVNRTIRLNPGETKNADARTVIMTTAVNNLLSALVVGKKGDDFVITRPNGKRVRDFRAIWRTSCVAAGVGRWTCKQCGPSRALNEGACEHCGQVWKHRDWRYSGALVHDFRPTGVRSMVRRGVPERVVMTISGLRTRSVFDRYNIMSEADLRDAAQRMEPNTNGVELGPVSVAVALFRLRRP
jgi:integrase